MGAVDCLTTDLTFLTAIPNWHNNDIRNDVKEKLKMPNCLSYLVVGSSGFEWM